MLVAEQSPHINQSMIASPNGAGLVFAAAAWLILSVLAPWPDVVTAVQH